MTLAGSPTLGGNAIPGDPEALETLASELRSAAGNIDSVAGRVANDPLGGDWDGTAATSFRGHLQEIPGEIQKIPHSFEAAASAVAAFASQLSGYQSTANWLAQRIEQAQEAVRAAENAHDEADAALRGAKQTRESNTDPTATQRLQRAVDNAFSTFSSAVSALDEANNTLNSLENQAASNHQAWDDAGQACAKAVDAACGVSLGHGFLHGLLHTVEKAGHVIGSGVKWVAHETEDAVKDDIEALDWAYGKLVRPMLVVLGDVISVLQVLVLFVPILGEVAEAALDAAGEADSVAILGGDAAMAAQGKKGYEGKLGGDALQLGLSLLPGSKDVGMADDTFKAVDKPGVDGGLVKGAKSWVSTIVEKTPHQWPDKFATAKDFDLHDTLTSLAHPKLEKGLGGSFVDVFRNQKVDLLQGVHGLVNVDGDVHDMSDGNEPPAPALPHGPFLIPLPEPLLVP